MNPRTNRLINEKSPYLLQHAHNPVDWYPWGSEAFTKAKFEDKPIFLSIGYSTCHWCHVMERESFEDIEVAAFLQEHFVAIKVDREERPDIDHIYMKACQLMTGQGGWPLTIIMTAEKRPFFAGTYFPKHQQYGRPGIVELLSAVADAWRADRAGLLAEAAAITRAALGAVEAGDAVVLSEEVLAAAYRNLQGNFDEGYGGFGSAPKFPTPHNLLFLMRYWQRNDVSEALRMVEKTLTAMRQGGIYDHLGGGFSRYATDRQWLVPHFEKMLYDNALLLLVYAEAYQCTGKREYEETAQAIVAYIQRDMTDPDGGFYSAEDADSEGVEGKYYLFQYREVMAALGGSDGAIFCRYYDISEAGNFERQNILNTIGREPGEFAEFARGCGLSETEAKQILENGRNILLNLRVKRIKPHKDDKILTAWNALMIAGLAVAGRVFQRREYLALAERAAAFVERNLIKNGRIYTRYREGEAAIPAYLDEYAFFLWALVELYASTYNIAYLQRAKTIAQELQRLFFDEENGGFFFSGADAEVVLARQKEVYDGAVPSGNSVAIWALQRLASLTGDETYARPVRRTLSFFAAKIRQIPEAYTFFLLGVAHDLQPGEKIVVAGKGSAAETKLLLAKLQQRFLPQVAILLHDEENAAEIEALLPHIAAMTSIGGAATVYLCREFQCLPPLHGNAALACVENM